MKYYAGIGSRDTPKDILKLMNSIARGLYREGYTLRSGGAPGADQAFERGAAQAAEENINKSGWNFAEIFLPWPSFEKENRTWIKPCLTEPGPGADIIAKVYHPRFQYLSFGAKKLIARNSHQILGPDIYNFKLSDFVICWTKGAKGGGGTGQAIRIAKAYEIPVYDLADEEQTNQLLDELDASFIV